MLYFDHDTDASTSGELLDLRCEFGGAAVDCYWYILEQIYRDETPWVIFAKGSVKKSVAIQLCASQDDVEKWINAMVDMGLFHIVRDADGEPRAITSMRAMARIDVFNKRAETARENGKKGGRPKGSKNRKKPSRLANGNPDETQDKPSGNQNPKLKKRKEKGFLLKENPISNNGDAVENASPRCPQCGGGMRFDADIDGWRCRDGSCRATVRKSDSRHRKTPICPTCHGDMAQDPDTGFLVCAECAREAKPSEALWV